MSSKIFDTVIITIPDGERLIGKRAMKFHSYVSVLIPCCKRPMIKGDGRRSLGGAVYVDSPLNYVQFRRNGGKSSLRILLPRADYVLQQRWADQAIVIFCKYFLDQMIMDKCVEYDKASVQRWEYGLPCEQYKDK